MPLPRHVPGGLTAAPHPAALRRASRTAGTAGSSASGPTAAGPSAAGRSPPRVRQLGSCPAGQGRHSGAGLERAEQIWSLTVDDGRITELRAVSDRLGMFL